MSSRFGLAWIALFMGCAGAAGAADGEFAGVGADWRYYQSPNFELYSTQSERESRSLLYNLELLRAVVFERFKIIERTRLEVTVFAFAKPEHFHGYLSPELAGSRLAAFYFAHPDRAIICMGPPPPPSTTSVIGPVVLFSFSTPARHLIFHEYIHHLFRATNQQPTVWFNEGFAELLATIQVERDHIEIGHADSARLFLLQNNPLLPFDRIFGVQGISSVYRDHNESAMFYAQSWLFLHYLYFGEPKPPPDKVERFMRVMTDRRSAAKVKPAEFFQECFGYDFAELQKRLDKYVGGGRYRYGTQPLPKVEPQASYAARPATPAERRLRLAELAFRVQKRAAGQLVLLEARDASPAEPRVHEVLGSMALLEHDAAAATEHWQKAIDLGTRNVAIARELTLLECRELFARFDFDYRLPAAKCDQLRERLLTSINQEPAQSAAYEMLAMVEAFAETPRPANVNLVQTHFRQLSEKARTVIALAMVRVHTGNPGEAAEILTQLDQLQPDPVVGKVADLIRKRLTVARGQD